MKEMVAEILEENRIDEDEVQKVLMEIEDIRREREGVNDEEERNQ